MRTRHYCTDAMAPPASYIRPYAGRPIAYAKPGKKKLASEEASLFTQIIQFPLSGAGVSIEGSGARPSPLSSVGLGAGLNGSSRS